MEENEKLEMRERKTENKSEKRLREDFCELNEVTTEKSSTGWRDLTVQRRRGKALKTIEPPEAEDQMESKVR
jgi:hypothetical protein